jgi:pimeloyl-ACP methyl ester carboxylesterase
MVISRKARIVSFLIVSWTALGTANCQITRVVAFNDHNLTQQSSSTNAYHPEPIIFVHGITANRTNWTTVINNLYASNWFYPYHYIQPAVVEAYESYNPPDNWDAEAKQQWTPIEQPYLHTFNYGRDQYRGPMMNALPLDTYTVPPLASTIRLRHSRQSHDPVEWNSWQVPSNDYLNSRTTLAQRIDAIRTAYTIGTNKPNVILVGHSLGGLVICDYLQRKNATLGTDPYVPVRRAVTIDSLLWGSPVANIVVGIGTHKYFNPYAWAATQLTSIISGFPDNSTYGWVENANGATRYLALDLQDAINEGNMPQIGVTTNLLFSNSPFQTKLHSTNMPLTTEFVASGAWSPKDPSIHTPLINIPMWFLLGRSNAYNDLKVAFSGDQLVPLNSMAGYNGNGTPVFANLSPVDIRGYMNNNSNWITNHGGAILQMPIYPHLLDGVQYISGWHPDGGTNWTGFQKQYAGSPVQTVSNVTLAHTDEPGINNLTVLFQRLYEDRWGDPWNPMPAAVVNTWDFTGGIPQKIHTNMSDCVGYQIIAPKDESALVQPVVTVGVKNHSQNPVGVRGTNYWVMDGNEYLPANEVVGFQTGKAPNPVLTNGSQIAALPTKGTVTWCLVQLDSQGNPQYQYGLCTNGAGTQIQLSNHPFFIAAQGNNIAGLVSPQAERICNAPVDSGSVAEILLGINERQEAIAAQDLCPSGGDGSVTNHWTFPVSEWVTANNSRSTYLNFFPTGPCTVVDAFNQTVTVSSNLYSYDLSGTRPILTFSATSALPSVVLVQYTGYVGDWSPFTTNWPNGPTFTVPSLDGDEDRVAGLTITPQMVATIQQAIDGLIPNFYPEGSNQHWVKSNLLASASVGLTNGDWRTYSDGLVHAQSFQDMASTLFQLEYMWVPSGCYVALTATNMASIVPSNDCGAVGLIFNSNTVKVASATTFMLNCASVDDYLRVNGHSINCDPGSCSSNVTCNSCTNTPCETPCGNRSYRDVDVSSAIPPGSTTVIVEAYDNCQVHAGNTTAYLTSGNTSTAQSFTYPDGSVTIPSD